MKLFNLIGHKRASLLLKKPQEKSFFGLSFLVAGGGTIAILINWKRLPPELPLYYSRPWGEAQLASLNSFFLLPLFGAGINLINLLLVRTIFRQNRFLNRTLEINSLILNLLLFITIIKIIGLVL